jgi:hypothetical protein
MSHPCIPKIKGGDKFSAQGCTLKARRSCPGPENFRHTHPSIYRCAKKILSLFLISFTSFPLLTLFMKDKFDDKGVLLANKDQSR